MKKFLIALCAILMGSMTAMAYDLLVDDIAYNYNADSTGLIITYTKLDSTNYSGLINATIPSGITVNDKTYKIKGIGDFAFYGCQTLESISLPFTISEIGDRALAHCPQLKSINVNDNNTIFHSDNFNAIVETRAQKLIAGCATTVIPYYTKSIEAFAFSGASGLKSIDIPYQTVKIGYEAFEGTGLETIFIPSSVEEIGYRAFAHCDSLSEIIVENGNWKYTSPDSSNAIIEIASNSLIAACKTTTFPEGLNTIGYEGFSGVPVENIVIPESIDTINHYAFRECTDLKTADIPATIVYFGDRAFGDCIGLEKVYARLLEPEEAEYGNFQTFAGVAVDTCLLLVDDELVELYRATLPWSEFMYIKGFSEEQVELIGDVNLDGFVDVTDVNILINIILNRDQAENYDRRAYITDDDTIDVSDVNALINIILHK